MDISEKEVLIRSFAEEVIGDLTSLLKNVEHPIAFDGFEPSGRIHIAQGLLRAHNVNKLTKAGCKFVFLVADWFAMMNLKMGGNLKKIHKCGELMIETWKACGMDMENVEFIWSSEMIAKDQGSFMMKMLEIAGHFNVSRIKKCSQIMGRDESDSLKMSQLIYPIMQATDIFQIKGGVHICSLGMDQRKVNMLVRDFCQDTKRKPPVIISHHMLSGLNGDTKMSKSVPDNAIFMDDSEADVNRKIKRAFCEPCNIDKNPIMELVEHIILPIQGHLTVPMELVNFKFTNIKDLKLILKQDTLNLKSFKDSVASSINKLLEPVRQHFSSGDRKQLLNQVRKFK